MFEKFTDKARRVVVLAQEEAKLLNHNYIGTEHILLGLIHEVKALQPRRLRRLALASTVFASRFKRSSVRARPLQPGTFLSPRALRRFSSFRWVRHFYLVTHTLAPSTFCSA